MYTQPGENIHRFEDSFSQREVSEGGKSVGTCVEICFGVKIYRLSNCKSI